MFLFLKSASSISEELLKQISELPVVYYSIARLENINSAKILSSFEGHYVTGSRQQTVRAVNQSKQALAENFFTILPYNRSEVNQGDYVRCGDNIILQHTVSSGYLHSHNFSSPLNTGHEVSAYPLPDDFGNIWKIVCQGDMIKFRQTFKLLNLKMREYLNSNIKLPLPDTIGGQDEVYCGSESGDSVWFVRHGMFVN